MKRLGVLILATTTLLLPGPVSPLGTALGQTAKDLVGTWSWVTVETMRADGTKDQPFSANPKGFIIFDNNGRFAYLLSRPGRPKFASNDREMGTSEENKATVQGSLAYSGTYSVTDGGKTLVFHVEASTYPNAEGGRSETVHYRNGRRIEVYQSSSDEWCDGFVGIETSEVNFCERYMWSSAPAPYSSAACRC